MFGLLAFEPSFQAELPFRRLAVDGMVRESHKYSSKIAQHPVEEGSPVTSNIRLLAPVLEIEGIWTDTPVQFVNALFGTLNSSEGRSVEKVLDLIDLRNKKKLFDIVTSLGVYKNYFFQELTFPREVEDEYSSRFTATLVKINYVKAAFGVRTMIGFGVEDTLGPIKEVGAVTPQSVPLKLWG